MGWVRDTESMITPCVSRWVLYFNSVRNQIAARNRPGTQRALEQCADTSNKEHGTEYLADVFQFHDAHVRCYDQHHS